MSCFYAVMKKVVFNNVVKVIYFHPTPTEMSVSWQQVARDRCRFKKRTLDVEQKISWVFNTQHRCRVFARLYRDI